MAQIKHFLQPLVRLAPRNTNQPQAPMKNSFRHAQWDPPLIIAQIAAVQACFYASLCALLAAAASTVGGAVSLSQVFSFRALDAWQVVPAFVVNSLVMAGFLWLVVGRARQCWDFAVTAHVINLVACCLYGGFPAFWTWWLLNVVCATIMTLCGEFLCMKLDMQAIEMSHVRLNTAGATP